MADDTQLALPAGIEPGALDCAEPPSDRPSGAVSAFTFGDPTPVLDRSEILGYVEVWTNGRWYEPPLPMTGLTKAFRVGPHHSSAILVKRNMVLKAFKPNAKLSRQVFSGIVLDYLVTGNCYGQGIRSLGGNLLRVERVLSRYARVGTNPDEYWYLPAWGVEHQLASGSICHIKEPDLNQEVYGLPEYLGGLQSAFLNEDATLFRRKYFINGSHAGFIFYMTDAAQSEQDVKSLKQAFRDSKGPGNFKNLFLYSPAGKKDGVQIIPISEVAAKDEFLGIKNTTRDDVLAAHRVPPQLIGVVPQNTGGFGDVGKAADTFYRFEIEPLQDRFLELNDWAGEEVVAFEEYVPMSPGAGAAAPAAAQP